MTKSSFSISLKVLAFAAIVNLLLIAVTCQAGFTEVTTGLADLTESPQPAAWGDFDNDGWVDLYSEGKLWFNNGKTGPTHNGFTKTMGGGLRSVLGDYDNDSYLDIFSFHENRLFRNVGATIFVENAVPILLSDDTRAVSWADHDGDGDLDIYVGGYEAPYSPDSILENHNAEFLTLKWQSPASYRPARGITSCDFDEDNDMDIYVSNYRLEDNYLWLNDGNGTFTNVASAYNAEAGAGHSIGAAWGDIDNDGHIDLFAGNFAHTSQPESRFLHNDSPPNYHFTDKGQCGVTFVQSYASPALGDYDNDGDLDLFFTAVGGGGYPGEYSRLYRNDSNWTFTNVTSAQGLTGLDGYMAAWADYDNDGDLDLMTDANLYTNDLSNSNHWLKVRLNAPVKSCINAKAVGAQARILLDSGKTLTRQVEAGTGQGNQNELTLHFGLGAQTNPVDVDITWPNGTTQTVSNVSIDQLITVTATCKSADIYEDGSVNNKDLAVLVKDWLKCNDLNNNDCEVIIP